MTVAFSGTGNYKNIASDVVTVSGMPNKAPAHRQTLTDTFVLKLSYNAFSADALGNTSSLAILWLNPSTDQWVNAILGNSDGGAGANFVLGAYDPTTDFNLSWYGVDLADGYAWVVVDHNSDFGVGNTDSPIEVVPEPSTWGMLVIGGAGLLLIHRRRSNGRPQNESPAR